MVKEPWWAIDMDTNKKYQSLADIFCLSKINLELIQLVCMEPHLISRPKKTPFAIAEQVALREGAIQKIQSILLPNNQIRKIVLMGSSVKGTFGQYEPPGFRGSLFSDFDFIVFVDDDYRIPDQLEREPNGKPFPDDAMNLAYRIRNFLREQYDAEVFFLRTTSIKDLEIQKVGEVAGIPMTENSMHPHMTIYQRS